MNNIKLPKNIPLFPLQGVLLLPGGILPLHIFENRYLQMFSDALEGNKIIGMVQPVAKQAQSKKPEICLTGCSGKITEHKKTDDGRMFITLQGLCRFDVIHETDTNPLYRSAEVDYLPSGNIIKEEAFYEKHQRLITAASMYLPILDDETHLGPILEAGMSELVTTLSMHCPFSATEKQALLEAKNIANRADQLIDLLETATLDSWPAGEHTVN